MSSIVCATRAGEGSRAVQQAAIRRALSEKRELIFLYVVDTAMLDGIDDGLKAAVLKESNWMGRTLLALAERRAEVAGLNAMTVIRRGDVRGEILNFVRDAQPGLLMVGGPRSAGNVFADDEIEQFAHSIEKAAGVPVEIVRPSPVSLDD